MTKKFPVIDLFAGPGGLGEGFSAFTPKPGVSGFDIRLSAEMSAAAHQTLLLRKFYRAFDEPPPEYFDYLTGRIEREELFARYPAQHCRAQRQAWQVELGRENPEIVTKRIGEALSGASAWALIGGPPCQAYSLVGRSRMQSRINPEFENDHRHFLYKEYLRIVAKHRPPVFIMENVKGLLSATHGGESIFRRILRDLHEPIKALGMRGTVSLRYRLFPVGEPSDRHLALGDEFISDPASFVVRSENHGVPQARHRIFVLGIREDLHMRPGYLDRSAAVHVSSVLEDLPRLRSTLSKQMDSIESWRSAIEAVRRQSWFQSPQSRALEGTIREARNALSSISAATMDPGNSWLHHAGRPRMLGDWYQSDCSGITNHQARSHMASDLRRYFFAACFARANGNSPTLENFPAELMPDHRNADRGRMGTMFSDRFRVQIAERHSSTVTSHISKDGHYFIHYDPTQCRSLTVREAARLQTFPDSYHFEGARTEQYHQVGNAVPPFLAKQIAKIVYDLLAKCCRD